MTWLNTSVHSGFARSASEAMFPRLFPDAGWWCPSLNPAMGGTRLWDLSGRQNWGTLTNMANDDWVVSGGKLALDFDGVNDYVDVPANPSLNLGDNLTVSAWVKLRASGSSSPGAEILSKTFFGGSPFISYGLEVDATAFRFSIGTSSFLNILSSTTYALHVWYHVVGTYDKQNMRIFIDGVQTNSASQTGTIVYAAQPLAIGTWYPGIGTGNQLNGQLDDIRIYSRALTAGEVRQLYNVGRGNMPLRRRRRYTEQAGGFKGYWANRQHLIGSGVY